MSLKKILLVCTAFEISYLLLSFGLAKIFGQWSIQGELYRTGLRLIAIVYYGYLYRNYFYAPNPSFKVRNSLTPQLITALLLFLQFAVFFTNANNETLLWQLVFVVSGITAGLREELFYRGIVQNTLQQKFDYKIALALASVVFTLGHIQYIYYGQFDGLMLITLAGIIFGCIFILTGSTLFTALIHGLYDALLSVSLVPVRIGNTMSLPILVAITAIFITILAKKLHKSKYSDNVDNNDNTTLCSG
jgi:membrane protease YdiL (CAAX protease family)